MTENIILQSELEKQDKNQISQKKFLNLSDFEFNFSNASDFEKKIFKTHQIWIKSFTKRQILDWKKDNALDFELKNFQDHRFWKTVCAQKITFWFNLLRENDLFYFWCFSKEHDFELKCSKRVRFWFKSLTTRRIWDWKKYILKILLNASCFLFKQHNTSQFHLKIIQPLRDELTGGSFQLYIWQLNL